MWRDFSFLIATVLFYFSQKLLWLCSLFSPWISICISQLCSLLYWLTTLKLPKTIAVHVSQLILLRSFTFHLHWNYCSKHILGKIKVFILLRQQYHTILVNQVCAIVKKAVFYFISYDSVKEAMHKGMWRNYMI